MRYVMLNTREEINLNIVYYCIFSARMMNKMLDFCYEKVYVRH